MCVDFETSTSQHILFGSRLMENTYVSGHLINEWRVSQTAMSHKRFREQARRETKDKTTLDDFEEERLAIAADVKKFLGQYGTNGRVEYIERILGEIDRHKEIIQAIDATYRCLKAAGLCEFDGDKSIGRDKRVVDAEVRMYQRLTILRICFRDMREAYGEFKEMRAFVEEHAAQITKKVFAKSVEVDSVQEHTLLEGIDALWSEKLGTKSA